MCLRNIPGWHLDPVCLLRIGKGLDYAAYTARKLCLGSGDTSPMLFFINQALLQAGLVAALSPPQLHELGQYTAAKYLCPNPADLSRRTGSQACHCILCRPDLSVPLRGNLVKATSVREC